jgi:hypothetical protein
MSDEFCAGVQILLKRMESNPEEFKDRGKWEMLTRAVFAHKEGNFADAWTVRSLTHAEIDALHAGCVKIYRPAFDEYVMKEVLDTESNEREERASISEQMWQMTQGRQKARMQGSGWSDPRMNVNVPPGTVLTVSGGGSGGSGQVQIKPESVMSRLKKELGL